MSSVQKSLGGGVEAAIREKLLTALQPTLLELRNDSHQHRGHVSNPNTGESHFHLVIASPLLQGMSRVAQQRRIYQILAAEMRSKIHALSITVVEQ